MKPRPAAVHSEHRGGLVQGHGGYVVQQHHHWSPTGHTKLRQRGGCRRRGGGNTIPDPCFVLIGAPSGPLLMEIQTTSWTYSVHHWEAGPRVVLVPRPNQSSGLSIGWGGGLGADLLSPPSGPSCITQSCSPPAAVFFNFFYPCYWVEWGCFNPGLIPGVSLWVLICNTPSGNEPPSWLAPRERV